MKQVIQFTLGYIGYLLIGFFALRALLLQDDKVGFTILVIGLTLLITYVSMLEKKHGTPKYGGYIKLVLIIVFIISTLPMAY
ncbi:hypothetical protein D8M04_07775 [Oceanobacillus piezotolerans]|uniref:DUF3953 domain-containing protein n=1 Tax=Oceanobacillus piezotolerans TaxID=2448030 RepID=A0A498D940_9BACI|nr:hypothetical protein [Oceanobacillus piezotolerans]RLL47076.1 hypothetical protein D8M04_07775 [Oceanobacillus piezotolerans]